MGAEEMAARVQRHNSYARSLAEVVERSPALELLAPVTLSIRCFRFTPDELRGHAEAEEALNALNREILRRLHHEHHHIPSSTESDGAFAIRLCYIKPRTALEEVEGLAEAVERIGEEVWGGKWAWGKERITQNQGSYKY